MAPVAEYSLAGLNHSGTAPERPVEPIGNLWGIWARGLYAGTGSGRIWIQERRGEPVGAAMVCDETTLAPVYILRRTRRISGLTWEELASAMGVSKRTLHLWDAGQALSQKHLKHLHGVHGVLERLDNGNPVHLRNLLLWDLGGRNALVLLREQQFGQVEVVLKARMSPFPIFAELPAVELRKRIPQGVPLSSFDEHPPLKAMPEKAIKGVKAPRIKKG